VGADVVGGGGVVAGVLAAVLVAVVPV